MAIKTILGASSTDLATLQGSTAHDQFNVENSNLYIQGLDGDDTIIGSSAVEELIIDSGADDDTLSINLVGERSTVMGGSGADSFNIAGVSKGLVQGGVGNDTIKVIAGTGVTSASLKGGAGADLIGTYRAINDVFSTGSITGGGAFDNMFVEGGGDGDTI